MKKPLKADEKKRGWRRGLGLVEETAPIKEGVVPWDETTVVFHAIFLEKRAEIARFEVFNYHNLKMGKIMKVNSINGFGVIDGFGASESDKNILKYCKISSLLIAEFRISYLRIQN